MNEAIYLVLEGHNRVLRPEAFVRALRGFGRLLRELDASVSNDPLGSVAWEIVSLQKQSPAVIGYQAHPTKRHAPEDFSAEINRACISGLETLSRAPERPPKYSDRALERVEYLAKLRSSDRFEDIRVIGANVEASVGLTILANIQTIKGPTYESLGSVAGKLDAISVHRAFEFRIWSDQTGRPVTCRFAESLLDTVKKALRQKVLVGGHVKYNALGHPITIAAQAIERQETSREPTIEEVSGLVEDFTGGLSLADYLEELRNG